MSDSYSIKLTIRIKSNAKEDPWTQISVMRMTNNGRQACLGKMRTLLSHPLIYDLYRIRHQGAKETFWLHVCGALGRPWGKGGGFGSFGYPYYTGGRKRGCCWRAGFAGKVLVWRHFGLRNRGSSISQPCVFSATSDLHWVRIGEGYVIRVELVKPLHWIYSRDVDHKLALAIELSGKLI